MLSLTSTLLYPPAGFPVTAMRKRKEEPPPQRPNPNFDAELSPQVGRG